MNVRTDFDLSTLSSLSLPHEFPFGRDFTLNVQVYTGTAPPQSEAALLPSLNPAAFWEEIQDE